MARGYDKFFNIGEVPWTTVRVSFFRSRSPPIMFKYHYILRRHPYPLFITNAARLCQWAALEEHTSPPYTLTLKSNGCIIFIGALTPDKLLVTSKHSLGMSFLHSFFSLFFVIRFRLRGTFFHRADRPAVFFSYSILFLSLLF